MEIKFKPSHFFGCTCVSAFLLHECFLNQLVQSDSEVASPVYLMNVINGQAGRERRVHTSAFLQERDYKTNTALSRRGISPPWGATPLETTFLSSCHLLRCACLPCSAAVNTMVAAGDGFSSWFVDHITIVTGFMDASSISLYLCNKDSVIYECFEVCV